MTDNIGEQMTDEELHAAQPAKDFEFDLTDRNIKEIRRKVTVPNWMGKDGRWADVWNALAQAGEGNMAVATERIVRAMEFARQYGRQEAEQEAEDLRRRQFEGRFQRLEDDVPEGRYHAERMAGSFGPHVRVRPQLRSQVDPQDYTREDLH